MIISGSVLGSTVPIVSTPILTRLYSPSEFGILGIFIAVASLLGVASTGRFEAAILLPDDDDDALRLAAVSTIASTIVNTIAFLVLFAWSTLRKTGGPLEELGIWVLICPIAAWGLAVSEVLIALNNRRGNYGAMAQASVLKPVAMTAVQIAAGVFRSGAAGLVLGQVVSYFVSVSFLWRSFRAHSVPLKRPMAPLELARVVKRYIKFPLVSLPANLCSTASVQVVNILVSAGYNLATLGYFSMLQRTLGAPSQVIGLAAGRIYFKEAVEEKKAAGSALRAFDKMVLFAAIASVVIFTPVFAFSPTLFSVLFGAEWRVAGEYARYLIPFFGVRFALTAVMNTNNVFERQGVSLVWQVGMLLLGVGSIGLAIVLNWSFVQFLLVYSSTGVIHYIVLYFVLRHIASGRSAGT